MPESDGFNIKSPMPSGDVPVTPITPIAGTNPLMLLSAMEMNEAQMQNVKSFIVGGGAGIIHRALSPYLGDELAGGIGGAISAYLAKNIIQQKKK